MSKRRPARDQPDLPPEAAPDLRRSSVVDRLAGDLARVPDAYQAALALAGTIGMQAGVPRVETVVYADADGQLVEAADFARRPPSIRESGAPPGRDPHLRAGPVIVGRLLAEAVARLQRVVALQPDPPSVLGRLDMLGCELCDGMGVVAYPGTCGPCDGTGDLDGGPCQVCAGSGADELRCDRCDGCGADEQWVAAPSPYDLTAPTASLEAVTVMLSQLRGHLPAADGRTDLDRDARQHVRRAVSAATRALDKLRALGVLDPPIPPAARLCARPGCTDPSTGKPRLMGDEERGAVCSACRQSDSRKRRGRGLDGRIAS